MERHHPSPHPFQERSCRRKVEALLAAGWAGGLSASMSLKEPRV